MIFILFLLGACATAKPKEIEIEKVVLKPAGAPITAVNLHRYIDERKFFDIQPGMFNVTESKSFTDFNCDKKFISTSAVIKVEAGFYYIYGTIVDQCKNNEVTKRVFKSELPLTFLQWDEQNAKQFQTSEYFLIDHQLKVWSKVKSANPSFPDVEMLRTYENPSQTPFQMGLSKLTLSAAVLSDSIQLSSGKDFKIKSIKADLKSITYCSFGFDLGGCKENQDLSYLLK